MHQALFCRERPDVIVSLRVGECFIDKVEANSFWGKITINGLQTGNLAKERRSGQATKYQYGVVVF